MVTIKKNKLNELIRNWPRGAIYTQAHLLKLGITRDNVKKYLRNNWISSIGRGAYRLPNDKVDIFSGLNALQEQLEIPVHLAGRSVIDLKGYAHYAVLGHARYFLVVEPKTIIPKWFRDYNWGGVLRITHTKLLPVGLEYSFSDYPANESKVKISTLERAVLEMAYHIPDKQGFMELMQIMEGLQNLRPEIIQKLLEVCRSIKVKRIVLYIADELSLPWLDKLNPKNINIGMGKRVIQPDGKLNKKYMITVPRNNVI